MYIGQIHHFSITALVDSVVCFIDIKIFKQLLNENKEFAEEFMKDFSLNILSVYNRLIYLTQKQVHGKMADSLLYLFEDVFERLKFKMVLSKEDLADLSAMSKDSAVRVLKEFQNVGIIRFEDDDIELLDPEALKKISRIG